MENVVNNYIEIKEIVLNPMYATDDQFKSLKEQGFNVRWWTEEDENKKDRNKGKEIFTISIEE